MLWENQMLDLCETWPDLPHYSSFINIITEIAMKYISSLPGHFIYQNKSHFCDFHMLEIRGSAALQGLYTADILIGNHQTLIVRSNEWNKKYIQPRQHIIQNNW